MLLVFILLVIICLLFINNSKLREENEFLKLNSYCSNCGYDMSKDSFINNNDIKNDIYYQTEHILENSKDKKDIKIKKYSDKEMKNSLILIVGSVLIILSSIIFLTSTWYFTHNLVKTVIIVLVLGVFYLASYIADKVLNLKQTSKAFYYMALAYIPIALFSIILFGLFGKYFSLYGLGKYIYLTISSLVVAYIYYCCSQKNDNKILAGASIAFQMLSVAFFVSIFECSFKFIIIGLLIYNSFFNIFYIKGKFYFKDWFHLKISSILNISLLIVTIYFGLGIFLFYDWSLFTLIIYIILLLNLNLYIVKIMNKEHTYNYVYPLAIILIFYNLSIILCDIFIIKQLFLMISFTVVYCYEIMRKSKITLYSFVVINVSSAILYVVTAFYILFYRESLFVDKFILMIFFTLINYICYLYSNNYKKIMGYTFVAIFYLTISSITSEFLLHNIVYGYIIFGCMCFSVFIKKIDINLKSALLNLGNIFMWGFVCFSVVSHIDNVYFTLLLCIYAGTFYVYGYKKDNLYYKISSYIFLNIFMFSLFEVFEIYFSNYIIPITTVIVLVLEMIIKSKDNVKWYLLLQFILSFILVLNGNVLDFIILIILNICFIYFVKLFKLDNKWLYLIYFNIIPYVYMSYIFEVYGINYMYFISILLMVGISMLIYFKKTNQYVNVFYVYAFCHITGLEEIKYISISVLILGSFVSYLIKEGKQKDWFKGILYTLVLVLYNFIIDDLKIDHITVFGLGIYLIYILILSRNVLKKHISSYKELEYIFGSLICLIALFNYSSEFDGIIFVFYLVAIVIVCYLYKFGSIFLVSLTAILLNVLILTRTFWLSIPWWIYILLVGTILVGFSIYNEIKLKKDNELKSKLIELKKNLDI